jgi:hypothetical protein
MLSILQINAEMTGKKMPVVFQGFTNEKERL